MVCKPLARYLSVRLTATLHQKALGDLSVFYRIPEQLLFPDPELAEPNGLLGVGGDLSIDRLRLAYSMGIFPWYSEGQPILWHSPDPRFVLRPDALKVRRSLAKRIRQQRFEIRADTAFERVMRFCSEVERPDQDGTWITDEMLDGYVALHEAGYAHSIEAWRDGQLVGGLYGVATGSVFSGESMFALESDASKVAFVTAVQRLQECGLTLVDCQVHTDHLAQFGAVEIPRRLFLDALMSMGPGLPMGSWTGLFAD